MGHMAGQLPWLETVVDPELNLEVLHSLVQGACLLCCSILQIEIILTYRTASCNTCCLELLCKRTNWYCVKSSTKVNAVIATDSPQFLAATQSACAHVRALVTDPLGLKPHWNSGNTLCLFSYSSKESLTTISSTLLKAGKFAIGRYDSGNLESF